MEAVTSNLPDEISKSILSILICEYTSILDVIIWIGSKEDIYNSKHSSTIAKKHQQSKKFCTYCGDHSSRDHGTVDWKFYKKTYGL